MRALVIMVLAGSLALIGQTREEALVAMKKAAAFYVDKVSLHGGLAVYS